MRRGITNHWSFPLVTSQWFWRWSVTIRTVNWESLIFSWGIVNTTHVAPLSFIINFPFKHLILFFCEWKEITVLIFFPQAQKGQWQSRFKNLTQAVSRAKCRHKHVEAQLQAQLLPIKAHQVCFLHSQLSWRKFLLFIMHAQTCNYTFTRQSHYITCQTFSEYLQN